MVIVVAIGTGAGLWQMSRAAGKIATAERIESKIALPELDINSKSEWTLQEVEQRKVMARGRFMPEAAIWLDNRPLPTTGGATPGAGQSGFYVLMPMRLEGLQNTVLWVQRGWAPRNRESRLALPPVITPSELVTIDGLAVAQPDRVFELGDGGESTQGNVRIQQNLRLTKEAERHPWQQMPFVLKQIGGPSNDGLNRNWSTSASGVERHYAYAFQWFALALSAFLFWLIHGLLRMRQITKR
ncbi:MAG: SURF1 family protein [Polynucleobacter sp.]|nr:SURF1 family protein [Polynucleobacter sp.]